MTRPRLALQAILILLKYRALTDYRDPVYLGPRIGDKLVFSLIVLTLYLGEGGEMAPAKVRSLEQSLAVSGPLGPSRGFERAPAKAAPLRRWRLGLSPRSPVADAARGGSLRSRASLAYSSW